MRHKDLPTNLEQGMQVASPELDAWTDAHTPTLTIRSWVGVGPMGEPRVMSRFVWADDVRERADAFDPITGAEMLAAVYSTLTAAHQLLHMLQAAGGGTPDESQIN